MDHYFSIHEILAEETTFPVDMQFGVHGLGRLLDPSTDKPDVEQGAQLDLPLWLAAALAGRSMGALMLPDCYGEKFRRKMEAGADCVTLKGPAKFFYEAGMTCNKHLKDNELVGFLHSTFAVRYRELLADALFKPQPEELVRRLSQQEVKLYEEARLSRTHMDRWIYSSDNNPFRIKRVGKRPLDSTADSSASSFAPRKK